MTRSNSSPTCGLIFARLGSNRFPRKVLENISGKILIERIIERVKLSTTLSDLYLAIPETKDNDELEKIALNLGIKVFRGSSEDVLSRANKFCLKYNFKSIVRINGDCPFIDPFLIDRIVNNHNNNFYDYTSNILINSFPIGMHIEVIESNVIKRVHLEARKDIEREHVTPFIYNNPDKFSLNSYESHENDSDIRLCIDYPDDLKTITEIITRTGDRVLPVQQLVKLIRIDDYLLSLSSRFYKDQAIFY